MKYVINSQIQVVPVFDNDVTNTIVKNEPMLFSCNLYHARKFGGGITNVFIKELLKRFDTIPNDLIFDSRVHMLMKGWYPCIPGFHHDDVPRSRKDGQPNYYNPEYRSKHCLMLVGKGSATQFALGEADFPDILPGEKYYKKWHPIVCEYLQRGCLESYTANYGDLIYFDDRTWHQGTPAIEDGWRFFIRASWNTHRIPTNEQRKQVQIYLENPMEGW